MRELALPLHRIDVDAKPVVLCGDFDAAGLQVFDWLVEAAVAELELVARATEGEAHQLMAEADAEHRPLADQFANLGGLGFLTAVSAKERFEALELLLAGKMKVEKRMLLKTRLLGESSGAKSSKDYHYALNDVVINKGDIDQIVKLKTWSDQEFITTYRADGLIFSTPTGSTAYNLSSGGPIVQPGLPCILVTPICPFMLESRPVLLAPEVTLTTQLEGKADNVKVIVDGRFTWNMVEGSQLEVKTAKNPLHLINMPQKGYFEILRNKLNWGGTGNKIPELPKKKG